MIHTYGYYPVGSLELPSRCPGWRCLRSTLALVSEPLLRGPTSEPLQRDVKMQEGRVGPKECSSTNVGGETRSVLNQASFISGNKTTSGPLRNVKVQLDPAWMTTTNQQALKSSHRWGWDQGWEAAERWLLWGEVWRCLMPDTRCRYAPLTSKIVPRTTERESLQNRPL